MNKEERKKYYQKNKVKILKKAKEDYLKNKDKILKRNREYYEKNKDNRKVAMKKYFKKYSRRPQVVVRRRKQGVKYYKRNEDRIKEYRNSESGKDYINEYIKNRRKNDLNYAISLRLRGSLNGALKAYSKTGKIITSKKYRIDYKEIIEHLKPFPKDIKNYHVDHIKPLCSFNLNNTEEVKKAFDKNNLQWLTAEENLKKGSKNY